MRLLQARAFVDDGLTLEELVAEMRKLSSDDVELAQRVAFVSVA